MELNVDVFSVVRLVPDIRVLRVAPEIRLVMRGSFRDATAKQLARSKSNIIKFIMVDNPIVTYLPFLFIKESPLTGVATRL